jgi:hypothetical protein
MKLDHAGGRSSFARAARLVLAGCALAAAQALAAGPWLAGPSVLAVAEKGAFTGGGLVPASTVQLATQDAAGQQTVQAVQVGGDGTVRVEVQPQVQGMHRVTLLDGSGGVLASASFLSRP